MKKIVVAIVLLWSGLLLSCDRNPTSGKDDYTFEVKEYSKDTVTITVKVFASTAELQKFAKDNNINAENLAAFGKLYPSENKCTIFVVDPINTYEPEFIGHEVAHCFWGRWHPNQ